MEKIIRMIALTLAAGLALQSVYVAYFGGWEPSIHRSIALFVCVIIVIGTSPLVQSVPVQGKVFRVLLWGIDFLLAGITAYACWRFVSAIDDIENLIVEFSLWDKSAAIIAVATLFELTRRTFGLLLASVGVLSLLYAFLGQDLPWIFRHSGFSVEQTMEVVWYGFQI